MKSTGAEMTKLGETIARRVLGELNEITGELSLSGCASENLIELTIDALRRFFETEIFCSKIP